MANKRKRQFDASKIEWDDEELKKRIVERRRSVTSKKRRKRVATLLALVVAFALVGTMCGKDIVRLKAENYTLRRQQAALEKQRDELKEELKKVDDQEYIREQARKQLRLLNPGEILFTFDDEDDSGRDADEEKGGTDSNE